MKWSTAILVWLLVVALSIGIAELIADAETTRCEGQ